MQPELNFLAKFENLGLTGVYYFFFLYTFAQVRQTPSRNSWIEFVRSHSPMKSIDGPWSPGLGFRDSGLVYALPAQVLVLSLSLPFLDSARSRRLLSCNPQGFELFRQNGECPNCVIVDCRRRSISLGFRLDFALILSQGFLSAPLAFSRSISYLCPFCSLSVATLRLGGWP